MRIVYLKFMLILGKLIQSKLFYKIKDWNDLEFL